MVNSKKKLNPSDPKTTCEMECPQCGRVFLDISRTSYRCPSTDKDDLDKWLKGELHRLFNFINNFKNTGRNKDRLSEKLVKDKVKNKINNTVGKMYATFQKVCTSGKAISSGDVSRALKELNEWESVARGEESKIAGEIKTISAELQRRFNTKYFKYCSCSDLKNLTKNDVHNICIQTCEKILGHKLLSLDSKTLEEQANELETEASVLESQLIDSE
jgi:hypothetical protein